MKNAKLSILLIILLLLHTLTVAFAFQYFFRTEPKLVNSGLTITPTPEYYCQTRFSLSQETSTNSTEFQTLEVSQGNIENVTITGDLDCILNFTRYESVTIQTGAFSGQGFAKGNWSATIGNLTTQGTWTTYTLVNAAERRIYHEGAISGDMSGTTEGYVFESVNGSGVYDLYYSTWRLNRIGSDPISAAIELDGTISYSNSTMSPSTLLYIRQTALKGSAWGYYTGPLSLVVTCVRIEDENSTYHGEGFSKASYVSGMGAGEGWMYNRVISPGSTELNGMFSEPIHGAVFSMFEENGPSKTLTGTIHRLDAGLPPQPVLHVETWGPQRISSGQRFSYVVDIDNQGLKTAYGLSIRKELSPFVSFVGASPGFLYDSELHSVFWRFDEIKPLSKIQLCITVEALWGLSAGTVIQDPTTIKYDAQLDSSYYPGIIWNSENVHTWSDRYATAFDFDSELRRSYLGTDVITGPLNVYLCWKDIPTMQNYLATSEGDGQKSIVFSHSGGTTTAYKKTESGDVQADYAVFVAPALLTQTGIENLVTSGRLKKVIIVQSPQDILNQMKIRVEAEHEFYDELSHSFVKKPAVTILEGPHETWLENLMFKGMKYLLSPFDVSYELGQYGVNPMVLPFQEDFWIGGSDRSQQRLFQSKDLDNDGQLDIITVTMDFSGVPSVEVHGKLIEWTRYLFKNGDWPFDGSIAGLRKSEFPESQASKFDSFVAMARDPNIKYGPEEYVSHGQKLDYRVEFENEGEGTAFGVYFTDTLDEDLNASTLEIGPVISTNGSIMAGSGTYDQWTRTITWLVGEVGPGEGGYTDFSAKVEDDAIEYTEVINYATVYFPSVPETTRTNAIVSVVGQPDIAVANITASESAIEEGSILNVDVTVANEGYYPEAFNLTLYVDTTAIQTENVTLLGRNSANIVFLWNTTGFAKGNYTISAYAEPVQGETNTVDNTFVGGWVVVTSHNWELDFIASTRHPIVDFAVYNGSLYAAADNKLYVYNGSTWDAMDAPTFVTSLEPYENRLIIGGQGGLYCYDGTSFTLVFSVPTYVKVLGVYDNRLHAGTMLDNPPKLYYCNGSADNPANWYIDTEFSAILNFSGPFGSIDSFAVYNNAMHVGSGGALYSFDGTEWSAATSFDDVYAFLDMQVYNGKLYLATRDQGWRKPLYQGGTGFSGRVIEFDGENCTAVFDHDYWIFSLEIYNDNLYAGTANRIFTYNGTDWEASFNTTEGAYYAISMITYDGKIYAGMGNGYIFVDPAPSKANTETATIPEFPSFLVMPLFIIVTLLAIIASRRKRLKHQIVPQQ